MFSYSYAYIYSHILYKNVYKKSRKIPLRNTESICKEATTKTVCRYLYDDRETLAYTLVNPRNRDTHGNMSRDPLSKPICVQVSTSWRIFFRGKISTDTGVIKFFEGAEGKHLTMISTYYLGRLSRTVELTTISRDSSLKFHDIRNCVYSI